MRHPKGLFKSAKQAERFAEAMTNHVNDVMGGRLTENQAVDRIFDLAAIIDPKHPVKHVQYVAETANLVIGGVQKRKGEA